MHKQLVAPAFAAAEALHLVDDAALAMAFEIKDRAISRTAVCSAGGTMAAAMLRHLPRLMHAVADAIERHGPSAHALCAAPRLEREQGGRGPVALDGGSDCVHEARQMAQHRRRRRSPRRARARSRPAVGAVLDLKRHRQRRGIYAVERLHGGEGGGDELLVHRPLRPRRPLPVS